MTEHYVTLFDSLFLPQGLALHASLQRHAGQHRLWILCMDEKAHEVLLQLALPDVTLMRLDEVETEDLKRVKPSRSRGEYCWTLTPFMPRFVLDADPQVQRVTYVDADTWLVRNPRPVFEEFEASGKSVLITEHAYAPEYDRCHASGRYCVQFMSFRRDSGERVRQWWEARCIEWCHAWLEDGKFGDQMYLNDWLMRFPKEVHVLAQKSAMQAPWNTIRFAPSDAVLFHFHGLRLLRGERLLLTDHYRLNPPTYQSIYRPYIEDFRAALKTLSSLGHVAAAQIDRPVALLRLRVMAQQLRLLWRERTPARFETLQG